MFNKITSIFQVLFMQIQAYQKWFQMGSKAVATSSNWHGLISILLVSQDPVLLSHWVSIWNGIPWSHASVSMESWAMCTGGVRMTTHWSSWQQLEQNMSNAIFTECICGEVMFSYCLCVFLSVCLYRLYPKKKPDVRLSCFDGNWYQK